jgi:hypothetical protein
LVYFRSAPKADIRSLPPPTLGERRHRRLARSSRALFEARGLRLREAHAVGTDDWPVIRKLKAAGKLSYVDDVVEAGMAEIARRGLDR